VIDGVTRVLAAASAAMASVTFVGLRVCSEPLYRCQALSGGLDWGRLALVINWRTHVLVNVAHQNFNHWICDHGSLDQDQQDKIHKIEIRSKQSSDLHVQTEVQFPERQLQKANKNAARWHKRKKNYHK
jgi:hypothetical protein